MSQLHVFTNDVEWIVGATLDDALDAYAEWAGLRPDQIDRDPEGWEQLPDDRRMGIINEDRESTPEDKLTTTTKTCGEWAASNGRGFLCTTEY